MNGAIWCVLIFAAVLVVLAVTFWLEDRGGARADDSGSRGRHPGMSPAGRRHPPALPVDGRPLSPAEEAAFIGCLFASNRQIPEPRYRTSRG